MMKFATKDFPSSFFKQSSHYFFTQYDSPNVSKRNVYVLRNVFLWLVLINIVNFCISIRYNFGRVDLVRVLSGTKMSSGTSGRESNFEDILVGMYLRNEELYFENIDYTTVIVEVLLHINGREIFLVLKEGFYQSEFFKD